MARRGSRGAPASRVVAVKVAVNPTASAATAAAKKVSAAQRFLTRARVFIIFVFRLSLAAFRGLRSAGGVVTNGLVPSTSGGSTRYIKPAGPRLRYVNRRRTRRHRTTRRPQQHTASQEGPGQHERT